MVEASLVASAGISALVLLVIGVALARSRHSHPSLLGQDVAGSGFTSTGSASSIDGWVEDPASWFASFLLLTFGVAGVVMLLVVDAQAFANPLLYVSVGAAALGVTFGTYAASRNSGLGSAGSTFVTAVLIGLLAIVAIVGLLVVG